MNITMLTNQSIDRPTGIGRFYPLAKEIVKKGHSVSIIGLHPALKSITKHEFYDHGININYVGQMPIKNIDNQKKYLDNIELLTVVFSSSLKMGLASLSTPSDVIHIFKPQPINGVSGLFAKYIKHKRLYLDCDDYEAQANQFSSGFQRKTFEIFEDNLQKFCKGLTVNTQFLKDRYANLGFPENKIVYVPNGIDSERFSNIEKDKCKYLKQKLNLDDKQVILYFGNMGTTSGYAVELLIDAFVIVHNKIKDSVLLLVGGGEDLELLKKYAVDKGLSQHIVFVGQVSASQIPHYIKIADVSVEPIRKDGATAARFPLKILESMAVGVPVITSNVGDRSEILEKGRSGIFAEANNAESIAVAIINILQDSDLKQKIIRNANKRIKYYYWSNLVNLFLKVYELE